MPTLEAEQKRRLMIRMIAKINLLTPDRAIHGKELGIQLGFEEKEAERRVASLVEEARKGGVKIRSWRGGYDQYLGRDLPTGYSMARTPEEMRACADMFHDTAVTMFAMENRLMDFGSEPSLWRQAAQDEAVQTGGMR